MDLWRISLQSMSYGEYCELIWCTTISFEYCMTSGLFWNIFSSESYRHSLHYPLYVKQGNPSNKEAKQYPHHRSLHTHHRRVKLAKPLYMSRIELSQWWNIFIENNDSFFLCYCLFFYANMSKIFGVSKVHTPHTESHETHHNHETHETLEVDIHETHDSEVDIGQIAVDVLDLAEEIIIVAPVAWVDPSEIDIALSRNILTISWERNHPPIYLDAKRMLVEECYYWPFSRSIILPENLGFNKIKATVDHNTIMIHVPKITFFSKSIKIGE